jgi:hypothetical protein
MPDQPDTRDFTLVLQSQEILRRFEPDSNLNPLCSTVTLKSHLPRTIPILIGITQTSHRAWVRRHRNPERHRCTVQRWTIKRRDIVLYKTAWARPQNILRASW